MTLKKQLTHIIRREYQDWFESQGLPLQCGKGCATCCSVNVKTTSIEGELLYDFIREQGKEQWFADCLNTGQSGATPITQTTNGFAASCLAGEDVSGAEEPGRGRCIFLMGETCGVYEARPFSCRCFVSTVLCQSQSTAEVDQIVLTASTVVMQLLEHVAQREYWGNLQDVLLALSDLPPNKKVRQQLGGLSLETQARARLGSGQPIPGFLLDNKEYDTVMGLLATIFNRTIDGKRVEDILNGK
ncbi:MAG: YkgJ family cysteine cluster protein [Desulfobulbaceae bacterium]|jgi:Fe-S-cluster containining protein|nr:YkgJ family cysteine cluster protein [Desulfobulbaceae bacterium]